MLENVCAGLNARSKVYLSKVYFREMYPTCVSSKLCEFIFQSDLLAKEFGRVRYRLELYDVARYSTTRTSQNHDIFRITTALNLDQ